jgi:hypothetical protein
MYFIPPFTNQMYTDHCIHWITMKRYHHDILHIRSRLHHQHLSSLSLLTQSSKDLIPIGLINFRLSSSRYTINHVLSITVLCDIILMMIEPRELLTSISGVCNEWNRKYINRSSISRERCWRQQLSPSTISAIILRQQSHPHKDNTSQYDIVRPNNHQSFDVMDGGSKGRKGWCYRIGAHSTLRDRWRLGRYKKLSNPLVDLLSSNGCEYNSAKLMCNGSYLLGLSSRRSASGKQLLVLWDLMNDSLIKQFSLPLPWSDPANAHYGKLISISESSMCILAAGSCDVTLMNMNSGNWSKSTMKSPSFYYNVCAIASHGHPHQPMAYISPHNDILEELDLVTMIKLRNIKTETTGSITLNDDHTCIARSGNHHQPVVEFIDRRTSLPVHQIKTEDPHRYSQNTGIKWHDNHIMITRCYSDKQVIQLYDIRKGNTSTSSLSSSMIWSSTNGQESLSLVDFSNDFQIALLRSRDITSVVDMNSTAPPLYILPIIEYWPVQMTYDRLLFHTQLLDFS